MTAEQRAGLSDAALAMTQPCIDELIRDVSRRIKKAGAITDTAEYQIYRAQALGESKSAIEKAVAKQLDINEEVINRLFEYVADKSLTLDENGSLRQMTEGYERMSKAKTAEMLRDLWADTPEGKVLPLQTAYKKAMDFAFRQVATGSLDLDTAIRRAVTPLAKRTRHYLAVPVDGGMRRLDAATIYYIESEGHRVHFYTEDGDFSAPGALKALEEKLTGRLFARCNSGYLVNLAQVSGVQQNTVQVGPHELQISRPKRRAFLAALADYIGGEGA